MESGKPAVGALADQQGRNWRVRSLPVPDGGGRIRAVVEFAAMVEVSDTEAS